MTTDAFALKDCALIAIATGQQARSLSELGDRLRTISPDSLYFHFWGTLLEPRFDEREFNNGFAAWARHGLHDDILAERLAMVDPRDYSSLDQLRQELRELVEQRLDESEYLRWALATEPFEFIRAQIVVFDTDQRLERPQELVPLLPHLSTSSLFYHFIDARRRVPNGIDDFRHWLSSLGNAYHDLRQHLAAVDPYFSSLTELRQQVAAIFQQHCPLNP